MVYGTIQDFYTAVKGAEKSVVKFLVKNEEANGGSTFTVCAEIPNDALKFDMLKAGVPIGWKEPKVYIEIEGVQDIPFEKVGPTGGDAVTFYEHLKSIRTLSQGKNVRE